MNVCVSRSSVILLVCLPVTGLHVSAPDAELDHTLATRIHELARVRRHVGVTAVLRGVDTPEVKLRTHNLALAWLWSTQTGGLVIPGGTVRVTVTPVPGGDTVLLVLALALVLALLTTSTSRFYQHLGRVIVEINNINLGMNFLPLSSSSLVPLHLTLTLPNTRSLQCLPQ